jgi:hypothetical protein
LLAVSNFVLHDPLKALTDLLVFLIISELPILGQYFLTHWPLLSPLHGFFTLGLAMIAIGADILGNLNKPSASQASLGENIWRSVISSGIIVLVLGFLNIIVVRMPRSLRNSKH